MNLTKPSWLDPTRDEANQVDSTRWRDKIDRVDSTWLNMGQAETTRADLIQGNSRWFDPTWDESDRVDSTRPELNQHESTRANPTRRQKYLIEWTRQDPSWLDLTRDESDWVGSTWPERTKPSRFDPTRLDDLTQTNATTTRIWLNWRDTSIAEPRELSKVAHPWSTLSLSFSVSVLKLLNNKNIYLISQSTCEKIATNQMCAL